MVKIYRGLRTVEDVTTEDTNIESKIEINNEDIDIESLTIYELSRYPIEGWEKAFETAKIPLKSISNVITNDEIENGKHLPPRKYIFNIFRLIKPQDVKVLILGDSPNPTKGVDCGIAYSTRIGDKKQPTTHNIHLELESCFPDDFNISSYRHGDLTNWVKNGVMLLNISLTVLPNKYNSHLQTWMGFTSHIIKYLVELHGKNLIVFIWGQNIKNLVGHLVSSCNVLETSSPTIKTYNRGFKGCNHFIKANELLVKLGREPIKWYEL